MSSALKSLIESLPRFKTLHVFFLLLIAGWLAYQNTVGHPFVHDDVFFIQNNAKLADWSVDQWLTKPVFAEVREVTVNTYYRPLLEVVYRLAYMVFHTDPRGYHFINILFHIFNSWWVFVIIRELAGRLSLVPLGVSLLFLLHPVQSEAVACISGLSNTVYAFFFLGSFYFYILAKRNQPGYLMYALSLFMFLLSMFAKEQAVMLPVIIAGYEFFYSSGGRLKGALKGVSGFAFVLAGYFLLRRLVIGKAVGLGLGWDYELLYRLAAIPKTVMIYLGTVFFPLDLHYYRNTDILGPKLFPWAAFLSIAVLITVLIRRMDRAGRGAMLFGVFWFFAALGPLLNVIPLVNEYSYILSAEHFLYLPVIGIFYLILSGVSARVRKLSPAWAGMFIIILLLCVNVTVRQNKVWADEVSLFERTVRYEPDFARGRMLLGKAYYSAGRIDDGLKQHAVAYDRMMFYRSKVSGGEPAARIYDNYAGIILWDIIFGLETMNMHQAAADFYAKLADLHSENPAVYNAYGLNQLRMGNIVNAIELFTKTLEFDPGNLAVMNNLAACHAELKQYNRAEYYLNAVLERDPDSQSALDNLRKIELLRSE